jgi:hypothetical protein
MKTIKYLVKLRNSGFRKGTGPFSETLQRTDTVVKSTLRSINITLVDIRELEGTIERVGKHGQMH